jgi:hypothetical protein
MTMEVSPSGSGGNAIGNAGISTPSISLMISGNIPSNAVVCVADLPTYVQNDSFAGDVMTRLPVTGSKLIAKFS